MNENQFIRLKLRYKILMLIPFGLSLLYLIITPLSNIDQVFFNRSWESFIELDILLISLILLIAPYLSDRRNTPSLRQIPGFLFCALTPLSILSAWTLSPGITITSFGGYSYFLNWLTKYPNVGPINIQVFWGLLSVIIASLTPAVFAVYATSKAPSRLMKISLVLIETLCLSVVIIKLDASLLWIGIQNLQPVLFTGPLLRLAGGCAMFYLLLTNKTAK